MPGPAYRKMPARDLESQLRARNLPVGGTKIEMISRLIADDEMEKETKDTARNSHGQQRIGEAPQNEALHEAIRDAERGRTAQAELPQEGAAGAADGTVQTPFGQTQTTAVNIANNQGPAPTRAPADEATKQPPASTTLPVGEVSIQGPGPNALLNTGAPEQGQALGQGPARYPPASERCGEIPVYSGLAALGLQLSDIRLNVRNYDKPDDDLTKFPPPISSSGHSDRWVRMVVAFLLPFKATFRRKIAEVSGVVGEIYEACYEIWRRSDCIPQDAPMIPEWGLSDDKSMLLIRIKGWGCGGMPDWGHTFEEHIKGRTTWTSHLPLWLCRPNPEIGWWPATDLHVGRAVNLMYSYHASDQLAAAMKTPNADKLLIVLRQRLRESMKKDGFHFGQRMSSSMPATFQTLTPLIGLTFTRRGGPETYALIHYAFLVPRGVAAAVFDHDQDKFDDLNLHLAGWGDTVRDLILAEKIKRPLKVPLDPKRAIEIRVVPRMSTSMEDWRKEEAYRKRLGASVVPGSIPVIHDLHVTLTRQECALLEDDRHLFLDTINRIVCFWRANARNEIGRHSPLPGEIKIFPTRLLISIFDWITSEQERVAPIRTLDMTIPAIVQSIAPSGRVDFFGILPGSPDYELPLEFFIWHAKKEFMPPYADTGTKKCEAPPSAASPPSAEEFEAYTRELTRLYFQAADNLDTLQAMKRMFPGHVRELCQRAKIVEPTDFKVIVEAVRKSAFADGTRASPPKPEDVKSPIWGEMSTHIGLIGLVNEGECKDDSVLLAEEELDPRLARKEYRARFASIIVMVCIFKLVKRISDWFGL